MKRFDYVTFAAIALVATTMVHQPKALSQTNAAVPIVTETASPLAWREIRVRHIAPRTMAKWLNPAYQVAPSPEKEPQEFAALRQARALSGAAPRQEPVVAKLPQGVEVIADDPRSTLRVLGTEADRKQVEKMVAALDKPQRQVEIEAQIVRVSTQSAKLLNIDFRPASEAGVTVAGRFASQVLVGRVRGDLQAELQKLVARNKAGIIEFPRMTILDKTTGRLSTNSMVPASISAGNAAGNFTPLADTAGNDALCLGTSTTVSLTASATINAGYTVTLFAKPSITATLAANESHPSQARMVSDTPVNSLFLDLLSVPFVADMEDNETLVFSGLPLTPLQASDSCCKDLPPMARTALLLVTARFLNQPGATTD